MMAYQGDMYIQQFDGATADNWSWQQGQQSWGNSYDQLQYDQSQQFDQSQYDCTGCGAACSGGWDYQGWGSTAEQTSQDSVTWGHASAADAPSQSVTTWAHAGTETQPQVQGSTASWAPKTQARDASAVTSATSGSKEVLPDESSCPEPKAGAKLLTELRLAELKRLIDRDAQALRKSVPEAAQEAEVTKDKLQDEAPEHAEQDSDSAGDTTRAPESMEDTPVKSEDAAAAPANGAPKLLVASEKEAQVVQEERRSRASEKAQSSKSSGPPGLASPVEQCHLVLVDFAPESRKYGELPVRAGEEVIVMYAPVEDWIFGWKQSPTPDKGWLPAQCLGIGVSISDAETSDGEEERRQQPSGGRRRGGRGRGGKESSAAAAGATPSSGRKARNDKEAQAQQKAKDSAGDAEAWHHHGNWWSRQRHLKESSAPQPSEARLPAKAADVEKRRPQASTEEQKSQPARPARQLPPAAAAAVAAATADKAPAPAPTSGKAAGRGKGLAERPHRERPALSSLLDRLNKPLVAPKPAGES
eukprot:TRINITY_DN39293_c0_g1_i1.p1 TRINITY_DN39293_c0_g1~~TRINITY_DN39293_c0_g1_i1.p1  ORF type:complete len:537 (+),score=126.04 TRINITY_DN39293_c0_g1_i1:24-1613(+)